MSKHFINLPQKERRLLKKLVPALLMSWKASGLKQVDYAKKIKESRTTVSHVLNCLEPSTTNPEFKSYSTLLRLWSKVAPKGKVKTMKKKLKLTQTPKNNALLVSIRKIIREELRSALSSPVKLTAPKAKPFRVPKKGQIWEPRDKRRKGALHRIIAISNKSGDPKVTVSNVATGVTSTSKFNSFVQKYVYVP